MRFDLHYLRRIKIRKKNIKPLMVFMLAVLSVVLSAPSAVTVFSAVKGSTRKLPIYSVETEEKKVSISFDAAWGASKLGGRYKEHEIA